MAKEPAGVGSDGRPVDTWIARVTMCWALIRSSTCFFRCTSMCRFTFPHGRGTWALTSAWNTLGPAIPSRCSPVHPSKATTACVVR